MEDSTLLGIALFTSLAGLALLWFVSASFEPEVVSLDALSDEQIGQVVTINGIVSERRDYEKAAVLMLEDSEVVVFGMNHILAGAQAGDNITVSGEIKEYNGELEILPGKPEDVIIEVKGQVNFGPVEIALDELSDGHLGEIVKVRGVVSERKDYDQAAVLSLENSNVTVFGMKDLLAGAKAGDAITVIGDVKEYKGALEILPNKEGDVLIESRGS
ncbi:MAG: hypothetical protein ABIG20_02730 [archaeon]